MFVFIYLSYHLNLQIVLNTPKNSPLKSSYPKKMLAKFFHAKNSLSLKCQTQKILQSPPSLEIRSTPPLQFLNSKDTRKTCFYFQLIVESETIFDDNNEKTKHVNQYNDIHMLNVLSCLEYERRYAKWGAFIRENDL